MIYWLIISFLLTVFYIGIMYTYKNEWEEIDETNLLSENVSTAVSIIIPARNEAKNIEALLYDITQLIYPKELLEVIIIDDHSEDNTFEICNQFAEKNAQIRVFRLEDLLDKNTIGEVYKKRAIDAAVNLATGNLIITTDADCRVQPEWIVSIVSAYETHHYKLIAAPVCFYEDHTYFEKFQTLDFCGMQAITAASLNLGMFNMANGANLAYEKQAFIEVKGYEHIDKKASGDDMLLVYKIAQLFPDKINFLKNKKATVYTKPMHDISGFLQQRFRWTSKAGSYQDKRITAILGLVYFFVLSIWINVIYFVFKTIYSMLFPDPTLVALINFLPVLFILLILLFQLIAKSFIDYLLLRSASGFFKREDLMSSFFYSECYHIWYIPFVGTFGNILRYNWKGRILK